MKKIKWIIISFVALITILNLCKTDKPLQLESMNSNVGYWDEKTQMSYNFYYLRNFNDTKEDLKHIVKYLRDSVDCTECYPIHLCETNRLTYNGSQIFLTGNSFIIGFERLNSPNTLFNEFETFSKHSRYNRNLNFNYDIEYCGSSAIVILNYYKLNSDILQKFLNIVYYKRQELGHEYNEDKNMKVPENYYLLNGKENKVEVSVNYPHEYKDYFTIDIY